MSRGLFFKVAADIVIIVAGLSFEDVTQSGFRSTNDVLAARLDNI
jgi:hypothetical protein